eukprot:CAMPEP_0197575618 /NCGR_PEP_ID=MMETSP1326-20131121/964_1 /TAXON_ID=1155430 /ORGANISM="Genus nov. species nov., Strain RCC2288" /LENGTH=31 /DNA_ID= /DNA_START= /DNA_END= /DNA_ORIENTATION=
MTSSAEVDTPPRADDASEQPDTAAAATAAAA